MAKISYEEILSLQRKINIVDVIKEYVPLTQKGKNYFGVCPFHDDHNPSMSVSNEKQMYKCFVCGNAGNVFNFVMEFEKVSYYEAVKIVGKSIGLNVDIGNINNNFKKNPLYDIYSISCKFYQNSLNTSSGKIAKNYLKNRNITDDMINYFQIGLSPSDNSLTKLLLNKNINYNDIVSSGIAIENNNSLNDIYKNRIMFPLWDLNGNVVGFSGRVYDESSSSKYINTMETDIFKKGNLLYNYHNAKEYSRKDSIIVVEGFMDVIRLYSIGIKNVVATMGTAITKNQASLIRKLSSNIILMFDGDEAGNKATLTAIEELNDFNLNIKIIRLEDNLDPDEYILKNGKEKMIDHLNHGISVFDYKSNILKKKYDFNNANDISRYINQIKSDLEKISDDIIRDVEIKKISDLTGVQADTIRSKLDIKPQNVKILSRQVNNKQNKYDKASKYILFHMIYDSKLIDYYFNNLSYLPNDSDRLLASEMVLFYKKFQSFNYNDFIVYLKDKKDLINNFINISELNYDKNYDIKDIDVYFDSIREYISKKEINNLLLELKNTNNEVLRKEIAKKIVDIKLKEKK